MHVSNEKVTNKMAPKSYYGRHNAKLYNTWHSVAVHPERRRLAIKPPSVSSTISSLWDERSAWGSQHEFMLACVGYCLTPDNIWLTPYVTHANGGAAFFIPYIISLIAVGTPMFCLEIFLGQFASQGPISAWEVNPLFKGLGYSMVLISAVRSVYLTVILSWVVYYAFASVEVPLPWTTCGNEWNTCSCRTANMTANLTDPLMWYQMNGLNCTGIDFTQFNVMSSAKEYFLRGVLKMSSHAFDRGEQQIEIVSALLIAWIFSYLCLFESATTLGKVVYVTAVVPYILLICVLLRGVTMEGAGDGINTYLTPDFSKLGSPWVWCTATHHSFLTLSMGTGTLTALASYNKFKNNIVRDSIVVCAIHALTGFAAGIAVFSVAGFFANIMKVPLREPWVEVGGSKLMFVTYPKVIALMPMPNIWATIVFSMAVFIHLGTQLPAVETVFVALEDEFRILRSEKAQLFRAVCCTAFFFLGLLFTGHNGIYWLNLCDYHMRLPVVFVGFFELVAVIWIYGYRRLTEDILMMVGWSKWAVFLIKNYFLGCWMVVTPFALLTVMVGALLQFKPAKASIYPEPAQDIAYGLVAVIVGATVLRYTAGFLVNWCLVKFKCSMCLKIFKDLHQPTQNWRPALPENRTIPRYQTEEDIPVDLKEDSSGEQRPEEDKGAPEAGGDTLWVDTSLTWDDVLE